MQNHTKAGKLIGITGGVGSGKSTALKYLEDTYGAKILYADEIGSRLQQKGGACFAPMVELLGNEILGEDGEIDRAKTAGIVFGNEDILKKINAIVHPAVRREALSLVEEYRANDPECVIFLESAIFVEAGYLDFLDELWLVTCDEEVRTKRLSESRGYTKEKCDTVMKRQMSDDEYRVYADHVITNNGEKKDLYRQIDLYMTEPVFGLDIGTRSVVGTVGYLKGGLFYVHAQAIREHETRAMLDGQIHDVGKVASVIRAVKEELEESTGIPLKKVCIAAAGRVLKTCNSHSELSFESDRLISGEDIYELESLTLEKAYLDFEQKNGSDSKEKYYLVGHSVTKEYLNGNAIGNLENQRGNTIGMDLIATFLPEDVIEGLYRAVELAGLEVSNLTLEPIAASLVAIPENYRMLNIALVDVGAGTSDICITDEGTIRAYGMIPRAGDALTELIAKHCLVDFGVAEEIKRGISVLDEVSYADILGIPQTITRKEVLELLEPMLHDMACEVSNRIISLNANKPVSAIFVVGGGGLVEGYTALLAEAMGIPVNRVALRGEEILNRFVFLNPDLKKDSLMVTPLGICLNFYEQNNNFIYVNVNKERIKLYNNGKLRVVDALMQMNVPNENIFPKRGRTIRFTINGEIRLVKGLLGEAASVTVNGEAADIRSTIRKNDFVEITFSTRGKDAEMSICDLAEYKKLVDEPLAILVNGHVERPDYEIRNGDIISVESLDGDTDFSPAAERASGMETNRNEISEAESEYSDNRHATSDLVKEPVTERKVDSIKTEFSEFIVAVNGKVITMKGKEHYIFVDIFDYIDFDLKSPKGRKIVTKVNGVPVSNYMQELTDGAVIDLYWED